MAALDIAEAARALSHRPGCRVLAVLGYSAGGAGLHPVCAARLERAAAEAEDDDIVVLTGWARRKGRPSEAELMTRAWRGPSEHVVVDPSARTTAGNAAQVAALARRLGAGEVLVVTSRWHAARAGVFFRALLRDTGSQVTVVCPHEPRSLRWSLRELWRWPLVPLQLARERESRRPT